MGSAERKEEIKIPLRQLYNVICDYGSYPEFVTGMKAAEVLGSPEEGQDKVRFDLELVKRLRYEVLMKRSIATDNHAAIVQWELIEGDLLKKNSGRWELKALSPELTEVKYSLEVEFNFRVPGFILKGLIANSLPLAIREFADRARSQSET